MLLALKQNMVAFDRTTSDMQLRNQPRSGGFLAVSSDARIHESVFEKNNTTEGSDEITPLTTFERPSTSEKYFGSS